MNNGTKIRTALAVATSINMALATIDVAQFGNEKVNMAYKVISVLVNAVVVGLVAYYNNDYTEEACIGTGITRQLKSEQTDDYIGDIFYGIADDDDEEVGDDDE